MVIFLKRLFIMPLLVLALMMGGGAAYARGGMTIQNHNVQSLNSIQAHDKASSVKTSGDMAHKMNCHQVDNRQASHDTKDMGQNNGGDNCCDHDCKCVYSHCLTIFGLVTPDFAFQMQNFDMVRNVQNPNLNIRIVQHLPERPPKIFS